MMNILQCASYTFIIYGIYTFVFRHPFVFVFIVFSLLQSFFPQRQPCFDILLKSFRKKLFFTINAYKKHALSKISGNVQSTERTLQTTRTTTCTPYYILYIRITMNNLLKTDSTRTESHYANETKRMQQTFNVYLEVTERDNNVEIKWSILDRTPAFKNCSKRCTEKI